MTSNQKNLATGKSFIGNGLALHFQGPAGPLSIPLVPGGRAASRSSCRYWAAETATHPILILTWVNSADSHNCISFQNFPQCSGGNDVAICPCQGSRCLTNKERALILKLEFRFRIRVTPKRDIQKLTKILRQYCPDILNPCYYGSQGSYLAIWIQINIGKLYVSKTEVKKTIPILTVSEKVQSLGRNLTKKSKDFSMENWKDISETN